MSVYLSIILPAYNEEGVIRNNVIKINDYLSSYLRPDQPWEIIVVDDGSSDSTGKALQELAGEMPSLIVCTHPRNFGRGRALRTGMDASRGHYVITMDADLSYSVDHIRLLLSTLQDGSADMVLASPFHKQGKAVNVPWKRLWISKIANRILAPSVSDDIRTVTCVVRGYTREVVDQLELFSDKKDIHLEILLKAKLLGFHIVEVPATLEWTNERRSTSKRGFSLGSFAKMANQHLFYNFLLQPSLVNRTPIVLLAVSSSLGGAILLRTYVKLLFTTNRAENVTWFEHAVFSLRDLFLNGQITFFLTSLSVLLLFNFFTLSFLAKQNSHQFDEAIKMLSRMNQRLKYYEKGNEKKARPK